MDDGVVEAILTAAVGPSALLSSAPRPVHTVPSDSRTTVTAFKCHSEPAREALALSTRKLCAALHWAHTRTVVSAIYSNLFASWVSPFFEIRYISQTFFFLESSPRVFFAFSSFFFLSKIRYIS